MTRNTFRIFSLILVASFLLAACGAEATTPMVEMTEEVPATEPVAQSVDPEEAGILPLVDPAAFAGDIIIAGSSTVYPLAETMAIRFGQEGFTGNITIDSIGSGAGFERFCDTVESDIANASRPIKQEEIDLCRTNGREPIEFRVGTDALAIVVSKENTFVTNITLEQLALIFSTATLWSDVDPSWPAEAIQRFSPGTDSGTFDYFVEVVLDKDEALLLNAENLQLSEDDNVLVQGVEGSPYAIGYFGFAYYQENASRLTALSIDGVAPNAETAESNDYPLSRPLFIYSDAAIMQQKPQVAAFINFFLTYVNEEIIEVGYFPASNEALTGAMQAWNDATTGTITPPVASTPVVTEETGLLPMVDPAEYSGDIIMAGSSTVYPLAEAMAIRFNQEGFAGNITIDSIGSGAGFERFCDTVESDIANASRPIKQEEIDLCRANGREPIQFRVGTDALAIVVSTDNTFLTDVTLEQLALIFSTATLWSDVDPAWPAEPIQRFSPGTDSGTFDYFVEVVLGKDEALLLNAENLQLSEDDNVLVQGVQGSPYAIGYFGFAYYQENANTLKALSINGIAPNAATAESNEYPLSRPLFIYSDAAIMQQKPQVAAFINFFLTYVNEEILDVGYFPASDEALTGAMQAWNDAIP